MKKKKKTNCDTRECLLIKDPLVFTRQETNTLCSSIFWDHDVQVYISQEDDLLVYNTLLCFTTIYRMYTRISFRSTS